MGLPIISTNTPMSSISCLNVENPENQADQFWAFLPKMQIYYTKPWKNAPNWSAIPSKPFGLRAFSVLLFFNVFMWTLEVSCFQKNLLILWLLEFSHLLLKSHSFPHKAFLFLITGPFIFTRHFRNIYSTSVRIEEI